MYVKITGYLRNKKIVSKRCLSRDNSDFSKEHKFKLNGEPVRDLAIKIQLKRHNYMWNTSKNMHNYTI